MAHRRDVLRAVVGSAVLAATPLSVIEALAADGPARLALADGTQLLVRKDGERYRASHVDGARTIAERPTGTFALKSGEAVQVADGLVTQADVKAGDPARRDADNTFVLFWKN